MERKLGGISDGRSFRIVFAIAVASMSLAAFSAYHRTPWSDEGWFSSASVNLVRHGFLGTTVLDVRGNGLTRIGQRTYWVMPLFLLGQAAWLVLFPTTIFWARAFTILWMPVALIAWFVFLARFLGSRGTALLGTALLGLSYTFTDNGGFARPDLMCCALGLAGLATYVSCREKSLAGALLLGNACVAASVFTHPNGVLHLIGLATVALWLDRSRLSWRRTPGLLLASALPYLVLSGAWSLYVARDYQAFVDQIKTNGTNGRWETSWNPLRLFVNEIVERYMVAFGLVTGGFALGKLCVLCAYISGIMGVMLTPELRKRERVRGLLILLAVYFAAMSVFNQKLSYYLIHIVPLYAAVLAVWAHWLWNSRPRLRGLVAAAIAIVILVDTGGIVLRARRRSYIESQRRAIAFLTAQTVPSSRIDGTAGLLYSLGFDERLRDDPLLGLRAGPSPDAVVVDPDIWAPLYLGWEKQRFAEMGRIIRQLPKYRLAYDRDGYKIYLIGRK